MTDLIRFHGVTFGYDRHPAVHHLSGAFRTGSLTAVVGPNGAGKSTLLKGMVGLLPTLGGRVERVKLKAAEIAYLPQQVDMDRTFPISVLDCVLLGHWRRSGAFVRLDHAAMAAAGNALEKVGLAGFDARPVESLSVGQFQRVLFARLLVQDARMILLDEPFAALDAPTTDDLLVLVRNWHREERTVVLVVHDLEQVRRHFPETLLLARELVGWGPTADVLTPSRVARAMAMPETWNEAAGSCQLDAALSGGM